MDGIARQRKALREKRQWPRLKVNLKARAMMQLFGSSHLYEMETVDISYGGFLLRSSANLEHFNTSSLLEIWLETSNGEEPIYLVAKFVRHADQHSIGVRIVDFDATSKERYTRFLEQFVIPS